MGMKRYNLQSKKTAAVILHLFFLFIALLGVSLMYLNTNYGKGLGWLLHETYEDTSVFSQQLQKDIDKIFYYVNYRDVFETDGEIDLSKPILKVSNGPNGDKLYTLDEIIRAAKTQGYYLNDKFQITGQPTETSTEEPDDVMVIWRAYNPEQKYAEPGDAYNTMEELYVEVLTYVGDYYSAVNSLFDIQSNLIFEIYYNNVQGTRRTIYTNNIESLTVEQLKQEGKYIYLSGDNILMDSNLSSVPKNVSPLLESFNPYDSNQYHMIASIDTSYEKTDAYAREYELYQKMKSYYIVGLILLALGTVICLMTLYYLVLVSGYRDYESAHIRLHHFDELSTELGLFFCTLGTLFALFIGEEIGYRMLHLVVKKEYWYYAERLFKLLILYSGLLLGSFSLLRRYKARTLWNNSLMKRFFKSTSIYFTQRTFTLRITAYFLGYLFLNGILIGAVIYLFSFLSILPAKIMLALVCFLWFLWNLWTFHRLCLNSIQQDKIGEAIHNISSGDTSYKIDITDFFGKEKILAENLNNIGSGMETALQEKVKSERLKADLITNVSHDIKTPLTSIINYVDLIKREHIPNEKLQIYLEVLDQKSQRLKTLTEDLVEASKASSGNLKLEISDIDLIELILQTSGEFEDKFAARSLELVTEFPEGTIIIEADGKRLWRILENLYNNSCKYSMEHSRIYVTVAKIESQAVFTIKNVSERPLNINPDELTERFVRGDVARTTEGSGLGLSIARSLTELQNGIFKVIIDGDLFKVTVEFPLAKRKA